MNHSIPSSFYLFIKTFGNWHTDLVYFSVSFIWWILWISWKFKPVLCTQCYKWKFYMIIHENKLLMLAMTSLVLIPWMRSLPPESEAPYAASTSLPCGVSVFLAMQRASVSCLPACPSSPSLYWGWKQNFTRDNVVALWLVYISFSDCFDQQHLECGLNCSFFLLFVVLDFFVLNHWIF